MAEQAMVVSGDAVALPAITAEQMVAALDAYRGLQNALDRAMPDQIMSLDGKQFRKKGYWRAIALAFKLNVEPIEEHRGVSGKFLDGRENFGWTVTYRATHSSGRSAVGDGSCFAVEKARRFKCPHPESEGSKRTKHFPHNTCPEFDQNFQWRVLPADATEHNVRSHGHTRAFNRAVSNLVGFGEVSAEEIERETEHTPGGRATGASGGSAPSAAAPSGGTNMPEGVTTVKDVTKKPGDKKPWVVFFDDGRRGSTFSKSDSEHAQRAKESRAWVKPVVEKKGEFFNLTGFEVIGKAETKPAEPVEPEEPVNGPEKILTVRQVDTDSGPRWVIQTDKRQVVTDQQAFADAATKARTDKVGLVPVFEVVNRLQGGTVNKLTAWQSEPAQATEKKDTKEKREREPGEEG